MEALAVMVFLSLPTFLIWRRIVTRWTKQPASRNIAAGVATIFATPIVYAGIITAWFAIASYYPEHDFDRNKWLADKEKRYEMSEDIIDSKLLIGKSKEEVRQLLGAEAGSNNTDEDDYWRYYLGYVPSIMGIDYDILDIYFENGKVVKVEQHQS
jgi:hypothetical protein